MTLGQFHRMRAGDPAAAEGHALSVAGDVEQHAQAFPYQKRRFRARRASARSICGLMSGDRQLEPNAPNQVWGSDITYLRTSEGCLYLVHWEVPGWSLRPRLTEDLVTDALSMAWLTGCRAPRMAHHADRCSP
jgi:transposase InsO family protein